MVEETLYCVIENAAVSNIICWDPDQFPEYNQGKHFVRTVITTITRPPEGIERDSEDPESAAIPDETYFEYVCTDLVHGTIFHPTSLPCIGDFYSPGQFTYKDEE